MTDTISHRRLTLRSSAWIVFGIGTIITVAWTKYQLDAFDRAHPVPGCGMPILGILGMAILMAAGFSLVASTLGAWAHFRQPKPRKWRRLLEVAALASPIIGGMLLFLGFAFL